MPYCQEKESQSSSSSPDIASLGKMEASPPLKYEKLLFLHSSSVCRSQIYDAFVKQNSDYVNIPGT